nr:helix-turn-helix transcriptional regulator [Cypionkella aquatica]
MARPENEPKTPLAARLRSVRQALGDMDRDDLAAQLNVSKNSIAYYERGDRTPDADTLAAYSRLFNVNMNWVINGEGQMFRTALDVIVQAQRRAEAKELLAEQEHPNEGAMSDMVTIPLYDEVRASAGHGSVAINETATTRIAFEPNWLADLGVRPESAVILSAQGDSMEPTIMNGAPMLVDTSKKDVRNGFIYVFDVAGDLMVKRIERLPDGTINLLSDNSGKYPSRNLDLETVSRMTVIGRVYAAVSKF